MTTITINVGGKTDTITTEENVNSTLARHSQAVAKNGLMVIPATNGRTVHVNPAYVISVREYTEPKVHAF